MFYSNPLLETMSIVVILFFLHVTISLCYFMLKRIFDSVLICILFVFISSMFHFSKLM